MTIEDGSTPAIPVRRIVEAVARVSGVAAVDILGRTRLKRTMLPRLVVYRIAIELHQLNRVARALDRDHSTVHQGARGAARAIELGTFRGRRIVGIEAAARALLAMPETDWPAAVAPKPATPASDDATSLPRATPAPPPPPSSRCGHINRHGELIVDDWDGGRQWGAR